MRRSTEDVKSGWRALEQLPITYHALIGPVVHQQMGCAPTVSPMDG
jgi:hypothetical protein